MKSSVLAALLLALAGADAFAYETPTHAQMTREAARASSLGARLPAIAPDLRLSSLESFLSDGGIRIFGLTIFEVGRPVLGWMAHGSIREDDLLPLARFRHHFYNPLAPAGQEGYQGGIGLPSLVWGLEPTDPIFGQEFSYRDAREYFYLGLTASPEHERKRNMAKLFRTVGQVVHLIQDAGQPQHTRNDSHGTGSRFEKYTNDKLANLPLNGYPAVQVTRPADLWVTPDGKGLANYTNRGFVTDGTNFTGTRSGNTVNIQPNPALPAPNGTDAQIERRQITDPDLLGPPGPNQSLIGEIWFVNTPVADNYLPGASARNPRTSTYSIFDEDLTRYNFAWTFTLNRFNFDAAHGFVVPRAVGYSTGLVDYFFRGRLEVSAPDQVVYGILDPGQSDGYAKIKLKVRNTTPSENMAGGTLWAVAKFHRNTCYRSDLTGEPGGPNAPPDIFSNCRSRDGEVAVSLPRENVTLNAGDAALELTFDFPAATPIPVNSTDLYLQVVYRGPLGTEQDAVAAGTVDLFEPTHVTYFNGTDVAEIYDHFYTFEQIVAGIAANDATFDPVDLNADDQYTVPPDADIRPFNLSSVPVSFVGPNQHIVATIGSLPYGRFARMAVLTDRPAFNFFPGQLGFTPTSTYNQLSQDGGTYFYTPVIPFREVYVTTAQILLYCVWWTSCNGDLRTVPPSSDPNKLTPMPVTVPQ